MPFANLPEKKRTQWSGPHFRFGNLGRRRRKPGSASGLDTFRGRLLNQNSKERYAALDLVNQEDIRVAILDINMYPIDGVALLVEIKKRSPSTQVIMMTGYPVMGTRDSSMKYGAIKYLKKPLRYCETEKCASWTARRVTPRFR